jgi:outer membrane protein insertion porin family
MSRQGFVCSLWRKRLRVIIALLLFVICVGDGGLAAAEPIGLPLRSISFTGNSSFSSPTLTRVLPVKEGGILPLDLLQDERLLAAFVEQGIVRPLSEFYLDRGYVEHELGLGSVHLDLAEGGVSIQITITEGKRYRVGRRGGGLTPGQVFSRTKLVQAMARRARALQDRGHAAAEITPEIDLDRERRLVNVRLVVDKGAVYHVERIQVRGNGRISAPVIRRALALKAGDRFSLSALERSHARLMAAGHFDSVNLSISQGTSDGRLVIIVETTERLGCPRLEAS